jgi:hypothetical protein
MTNMPELLGYDREASRFRLRRSGYAPTEARQTRRRGGDAQKTVSRAVFLSHSWHSSQILKYLRNWEVVHEYDLQTDRKIESPAWISRSGFTPDLEQQCAELKIRNESLTQEVRSLRALLSKRLSDSQYIGLNQSQASLESHAREAAASMLAELDEAESEAVFRILATDRQPLRDIIEHSGVSVVINCVSLLGNCHAALVREHEIVRTDFGRLLFDWINNSTAENPSLEHVH